jgi:heat shock protein HtpX
MLLTTGILGWTLFGPLAVPMLAAALAVGLWLAPRASGQRALRQKGARPLSYWEAPKLHRWVSALARRAGLKQAPSLYLLPEASPQALATGEGSQATIAVTPALLHALPSEEIVGVLAHEISHLSGGDLRLSRLAATLGTLTRSLSSFGFILLLLSVPLALLGQATLPLWGWLLVWAAPAVMTLSYLALSRLRELDADAAAAQLTEDPNALARALARIEKLSKPLLPAWFPLQLRPVALEAPLWLRTHPPTSERIERLQSLTAPARRWRRRPTAWSRALI